MQAKVGRIALGALAVGLWLATFILGLEDVYVVLQFVLLLYVYFGGNSRLANNLAIVLAFALSLVFLAFVVATTEYHWKRVGRRESWRLFGWTIAAELSILVLYYFLF